MRAGSRLVMVGLTHRGAALHLLGQVSVPRAMRAPLLGALAEVGYAEAVVLSTCSRTEIYLAADADAEDAADAERALGMLAAQVGAPLDALRTAAETRTGPAVVEHLMRVTAGLASRVIGEVEIHGQVRSAFRDAQAAGMTGPTLGPLFSAALRCGLRVRAQTTLGAQGRSLARRAVEIGLATMSQLGAPVVMVVGSGRMAGAAVERLLELGQRPRVAARDEQRAAQLAGPGHVCPLGALAAGIEQADVLICATSATTHVVTLEHVQGAMAARSRPLTIVDLSVPRNVDLVVDTVPGVRLIDLEGMDDDEDDAALRAALEAGTEIVRAEAQRYVDHVAARDAGPVIAALRRRVEATCLAELSRATGRSAIDREDLQRAAHAVAGKLLHGPTVTARAAAAAGDAHALRVLCDTFGIGWAEVGLLETA